MTGTVVRITEDSAVEVCIDLGPHPYATPSNDVRALNIIREFVNVYWDSPVLAKIMAKPGYGCGWGGGSQLFPISQDELAELEAEEAGVVEDAEEMAAEWRSARGKTLTEEMNSSDSDF